MGKMFDAYTVLKNIVNAQRQASRLLRLSFPNNDGPSKALLVANRLEAYEGLSKDFRFVVEVLSDDPDIALKDLLGKMITIAMTREDGSQRYFNGHVFDCRFIKNDAGFAFYRIVLLPWLAFLRYRHNNYIFHGKSVEEQTDLIFADYPAKDWQTQHLGTHDAMTDACQFDETDYNYLHRRWEAIGWHYWYEHRANGHTLILSGDSTTAAPIDGSHDIAWQGTSGIQKPGLLTLSPVRTLAATHYSASSFDFKNVRPANVNLPTLNQQGQVPNLEVYEYTGSYGFKNLEAGDAFVRQRLEEIEAAAKVFEANGNEGRAQCGRSFHLTGHLDFLKSVRARSDDTSANTFLILEVTHTASNNYEIGEGSQAQYSNRLVCLRKKIPWRPGRGFNSTEQKIYGVQTATVVGPQGEEVHTDEHGRVRVQFHWDREGQFDEKSSAFVRVASNLAGANFGDITLPRTGQEVIVQFLEGNPDRPIITGRVYNARNMPPSFSHTGNLPGNRYLSGLKTKEIQGSRYNQMRLDDTPGQISVQFASQHGYSQVNLGYLTHPRSKGQAQARGEGAELRTDGALAARGAQGVYITAHAQTQAGSHHLERAPLIGLADALQGIQQQLGQLANTHNAEGTDAAPLQIFIDQLKAWENGSNVSPNQAGGGAPIVAVSAPAGIGIASQANVLLGAQTHIDTVSIGNTQLSAGRKLLLRCGELFSVFAHGAMKLVAQNKVEVQSHTDSIELTAAKRIVLTAGQEIVLQAPVIRYVAQGTQVDMGGGQITQQSTGGHVIKSASFDHLGPGGGTPAGVDLPQTEVAHDQQTVLRWANTHEPMKNQRYRITSEDGSIIEGRTDAQGMTQRFSSSIPFARYTIEALDD